MANLHEQQQNASSSQVPFSRPSSPSMNGLQIGVIGLGNMGYCMARNLATSPHPSLKRPILVWNRTPSKSRQLADEVGNSRIRVAENPEQIALECDVIIGSLANDAAVRSIYQRLTDALKIKIPSRTKIFVETSTIYPTLAGELDAIISSIPFCRLITCPVLGTPIAAGKAELLLIMSGDYASKKEIAYLLVPSVGRAVMDLGGDLVKAPTLKLIANSMILGQLEIMAETFTFAEKSGISSQNVYSLMQDYFPAPSILAYAENMINEKFDGNLGFSIEGGIKDATHIRRLTAKCNSPMPAIDVAHQHLVTARAIHDRKVKEGEKTWDKLDWSGIIAGTRVAAGLNGFGRTQDPSIVELE